jgi:hypothetical protein
MECIEGNKAVKPTLVHPYLTPAIQTLEIRFMLQK